jgi:adenylate cyclase
MKKIMLIFLAAGLCILAPFLVTAQDLNRRKVDSLEKALKKAKADTTKAKLIGDLSLQYLSTDPDKSAAYANQALNISQKVNYRYGVARAYNLLGISCNIKSDFTGGMDNFTKAAKVCEEYGIKSLVGGVYNNIGTIYQKWGNNPQALNYLLKALKVDEEMGDKDWQANTLQNISGIYTYLNNFAEALKCAKTALKIKEELRDTLGLVQCNLALAELYSRQGNFAEAKSNVDKALKASEDIGYKEGISQCYASYGTLSWAQGNYQESLKNYFIALKIDHESDNIVGIANRCISISKLYFLEKKFREARVYMDSASLYSKGLGLNSFIPEVYLQHFRLDSAQGNMRGALENYRLWESCLDSINNEENSKKMMHSQMQYDFDKKQELAKAEQDKKDELARKELQKQKLVRNGFVGGFAIVMIFAFIFFRQRNKIKNEKKASEEARKIAETEKERSEELLLNILPAEVAEEIKREGKSKAKTFSMVTVLFTDFKDFTAVSERYSAELLVAEIDHCFSAFDHIIQKHHVEKIKTIGDAYLCVGGMPNLTTTHATDILNAAIEIRDFMKARKQEQDATGGISFELRLGVHTGPVVAGIVGVKKYAYDIWGDTVNLAARMEQNSEAGKINISGSTYKLVKEKFNCAFRGKIEAKNKGEIEMYFVER